MCAIHLNLKCIKRIKQAWFYIQSQLIVVEEKTTVLQIHPLTSSITIMTAAAPLNNKNLPQNNTKCHALLH